ncbi:MAG: hypothetical protein R3C03_14010 [Pirellulaceae bacterium]
MALGKSGKLELVGIPRLDKLTEVYRRNEDFKPSGEKFRVMVATAKTPGFTDDQVAVTRQMLIDLRDCFASDSQSSLGLNVEVVWRIGPELAEELELETVQGDLSGMELHDQLQNVDCVLTTPSTLMLESMLLQRPTALLNYHLCPTWVPAAWEISHRDAIVPVLKQLQNTALERLEWQRQIVRDHLQVETNATDRMVMLIESILEKSQKCVAEKTNLDLNEPILSPLIQYPTRMEWKRFYPEFNEFGFDSAEQLAAEWAQSRREIRHLQSELQQSRNELSEAHRIFEQIQNHPIAGPIVRIRQSFLDWVRSASKEKKSEST